MLAASPLFAFVPTLDMERADAFYGGTLGLEVLERTPYAVVLDAGGTTLRLTLVEDLSPQPFTILGWLVEDLDSVVAALLLAGVQPLRYAGMDQDERGVWTTPAGAQVVWFHDPDGNTLSLTRA
jgi:catechol 2,3-dioxygenase-like lactoylglutathione lyase family enzyme